MFAALTFIYLAFSISRKEEVHIYFGERSLFAFSSEIYTGNWREFTALQAKNRSEYEIRVSDVARHINRVISVFNSVFVVGLTGLVSRETNGRGNLWN